MSILNVIRLSVSFEFILSFDSVQDFQRLPHPLQEVDASVQAFPLTDVSLFERPTPLQSHILLLMSDDFQYSEKSFPALSDFKLMIEKNTNQVHDEFLRNIADSYDTNLLIIATSVRAYRNRHLDTLIHWCPSWERVDKFFGWCPFEFIDFHELSQIIVSLTRERITEWKIEVHNMLLVKCKLILRVWDFQYSIICLHTIVEKCYLPIMIEFWRSSDDSPMTFDVMFLRPFSST